MGRCQLVYNLIPGGRCAFCFFLPILPKMTVFVGRQRVDGEKYPKLYKQIANIQKNFFAAKHTHTLSISVSFATTLAFYCVSDEIGRYCL